MQMADMEAFQADAAANPATKLGATPLQTEGLPAGAVLPADDAPLQLYVRRKGYNDICVRPPAVWCCLQCSSL